jgi:hypothetical protein
MTPISSGARIWKDDQYDHAALGAEGFSKEIRIQLVAIAMGFREDSPFCDLMRVMATPERLAYQCIQFGALGAMNSGAGS